MPQNHAEGGVEQDVYHLLNQLFLLLDDCDRHFFGEYGLSTRQFWALHYLDEHQGVSMVDLSRSLLTDKSNVTAIIDRLEHSGLVKRTPSRDDRRVVLLTLTAEGRRLHDQVHTQHDARIRDLLDVAGAGHLLHLLELLKPIKRNLEAYLERADVVPPAPAAALNGG